MGVAIAVGGGEREFQRFAQHAEDDRVLARVVARAHGVIADLVVRPLAGPAFAAVRVLRSGPSRSAMISPNLSAVPLGASSLKRWCRSMISTSAPDGMVRERAGRRSRQSFIARLTARLMLGDQRSGIVLGRLANACCCCVGSKPVVATTSGMSLLEAR